MLKVLFTVNIPSPYRVAFFNELGKHCDLTVLFEKKCASDRDELWKQYKFEHFRGIFLKGISIGSATSVCFEVTKHLKRNHYDVIVCANFTSPTGILAVRYLKKKGIPYYLESDGGFAKREGGWKGKLKTYVMTGAKGYFSTGSEHDNYYLAYGATEDKLIRYPFTSLYQKDLLTLPITGAEKQAYKEQLGMREKTVVLAVGQFIPRKGFDVLLRAVEQLDKSVGVYFVGGIPTEEYVKIKEDAGLCNVHFEGFKDKDQLKKYYLAADLFVLPTREDIWGLVVNEAMACGLPVVTTTKCVAGLQLVRDGVNGYLVEADDVTGLAQKLCLLTGDEDLREELGENALKAIQHYTIEGMAEKHLKVFSKEE